MAWLHLTRKERRPANQPPRSAPAGGCDAGTILDLAFLLSRQTEFQETVRLIAARSTALFNADMVSIIMLNPGTQNTIRTIVRVGNGTDDRACHLLNLNLVGWVMKHGEPMLCEDLPADRRFARNLFARSQITSAMCVPIPREGHVCGHMIVAAENPARRFGRDELDFLEKCAAVWGGFLGNSPMVNAYFQDPVPEQVLHAKFAALGLLGNCPRFTELLRTVNAASQCDVRVFLEGESGSGKELVARAIHLLGSRKDGPFVALDCGAIPENLVESELFGHVKGAFTGATQNRKGLLEAADNGTLFLDEIQNLTLEIQAKLLRVLQDGQVRSVGSNQARKVDVRIISASHEPATKLLRDGALREDLFYRLHVYPICVPSLNDRADDIPFLAGHFLKLDAVRQGKGFTSFEPSLVRFMRRRRWCGNVRELENFVERLVTLGRPGTAVLDHTLLPDEYRSEFRALTRLQGSRTPRQSLRETLRRHECELLRNALIENNWNQLQAARSLDISERDIRYKMTRLGITKPPR